MFFLLLAIACTTTASMALRLARNEDRQIEVVVGTNYVVAAAIMWVAVFTQRDTVAVNPATVLLGLGGGFLWPAGIYVYAYVIGRIGLSITGATSRLSLAIPVTFGILVLDEPATLQIAVGLALIVAAFVLLRPRRHPDRGPVSYDALGPILSLMLLLGLVDLWINLFDTYGEPAGEPVYFAILFATAAVATWIVRALRRSRSGDSRPIERRDVLLGAVLGVPNLGVTWSLLQAIQSDTFEGRSSIAYAVFSSSALVMIVLAGVVLWGERLLTRQAIGIGIAVTAIVTLNLA